MSSASLPMPVLAPDYYLTNFEYLVEWVWRRYADLLDPEEQLFIQGFYQLDHPARCLLVRLCSRKGPLFRHDKLFYPEIGPLDQAARQLAEQQLLMINPLLSLAELAAVLTKGELCELFPEVTQGFKQARKEAVVQHLQQQFPVPQSWQQWTDDRQGTAWHLDHQVVIRNLLLLFFGNSRQGLSEFVLQNLGLFRYEDYVIDPHHRVFQHRHELEHYLQCNQLRDALDQPLTLEGLYQLGEALPPPADSERLQRRRARLCNRLAAHLEKAGDHERALAFYQQSHLPPARERRIRILEKQQQYSAAWQLLTELLQQPANEQELQVARRMAPRLARKLGLTIERHSPIRPTESHLILPLQTDEQGGYRRVEECVRQCLHRDQEPCFYTENLLLTGLFGLWLWPELFADVEDAFANPFQSAPLDMYQENFVGKRPGIAGLRQLLQEGDYRSHLLNTWDRKYGIANPFVNWSFLSRDLVAMALDCIPARHLSLIFDRLLFDIRSNRSGLPDLIRFFPAESRYQMIEVKGPGDRLQDNQLRWLEYFAKHDIPAEVVYVSWQ